MAESDRTQFAMKALSLADFFNAKVGDRRVSGHRVALAVPHGMSTGGGAQAVQHISLIPDGQGPTITAGAANQVDKTVELRTWEHLSQLHAQRFKGKPLPVDKVAYNELLKRMQAFFGERQLSVVLVDAARLPHQPGGSRASMVVLFFAIAIAVAGAVFFLMRK
jgi:hypothetical protein